MNQLQFTTRTLTLLACAAMVGVGCSKIGVETQDLEHGFQVITESVSLPQDGYNFRLSLTDAPHKDLSNVFVTIDHVELVLEKEGRKGRLILGQNMGTIDLLTLRDGVHLPISDLALRDKVSVKEFRLILKDEGHWLVRRKDGSTCELKTPSQQQTGLKIKIPDGAVTVVKDTIYSLTVDFDVDHSIVDNKNNCLLKPVLKLKDLVVVPQNPPVDPTTTTTTTTPPPADDGGADDGSGDSGGGTDGGSTDDSGSTTTTTTQPSTDPDYGGGIPIIIDGEYFLYYP